MAYRHWFLRYVMWSLLVCIVGCEKYDPPAASPGSANPPTGAGDEKSDSGGNDEGGDESDGGSRGESDAAIDGGSVDDSESGDGDEDAGAIDSRDGGQDDSGASSPPDCGDIGQSCCAGDVCSGGGCCVGDQCVADGDSCGEAGGACGGGVCELCGASTQACCDGSCQDGLDCVDNVLTGEARCEACGGADEPCCAEVGCREGECVDTGVLGLFICRVDCGTVGQVCCPRGLTGILGGPLGVCQEGTSCNSQGTCSADEPDPGDDDPDGEADDDATIVVRARGTTGGEHINLRVGGAVIADWTLSTAFEDYTQTTSATGNIVVEFDNDQGSSDDVQIDFIQVNGQVREAEFRLINTGAFANGQCGAGLLTEWMHCNGLIDFGDVN